MYVNPIHLLRCLDDVRRLEEYYKLNVLASSDVHRSVDELRGIVQGHLGRQVRMQSLPVAWKESVILGMFAKTAEGTFDICFAHDLPYDWKRFVICKELFHVVIDDEAYHDMDIEAHLTSLILQFPDDEAKPTPAVAAEFLGEIAAMEFLFPYVYRRAAIDQRQSLPAVAKRFGVPLMQVERYTSQSWMQSLDRAHIESISG